MLLKEAEEGRTPNMGHLPNTEEGRTPNMGHLFNTEEEACTRNGGSLGGSVGACLPNRGAPPSPVEVVDGAVGLVLHLADGYGVPPMVRGAYPLQQLRALFSAELAMRPNMAALLPNMATRPSPSPRRDAAACKSEAAEGGVAIFGKSDRNMAILGRSLRTASEGGAVSEPPLLLPAGKERGPAPRHFDPSPFRPLGGGQIRQHSSFQRRQEIGQAHSSFATPLLAHFLASYTHAVGSSDGAVGGSSSKWMEL